MKSFVDMLYKILILHINNIHKNAHKNAHSKVVVSIRDIEENFKYVHNVAHPTVLNRMVNFSEFKKLIKDNIFKIDNNFKNNYYMLIDAKVKQV